MDAFKEFIRFGNVGRVGFFFGCGFRFGRGRLLEYDRAFSLRPVLAGLLMT
jgi:hypothetical protein